MRWIISFFVPWISGYLGKNSKHKISFHKSFLITNSVVVELHTLHVDNKFHLCIDKYLYMKLLTIVF